MNNFFPTSNRYESDINHLMINKDNSHNVVLDILIGLTSSVSHIVVAKK